MSFSGDEFEENDSALFLNRLAKARKGTTEQQAELLNSFRGYLRAVALKTVGEEANGKLSVSDLVQSALIDACDEFARCRASQKDEFKAWLRQILMNDIVNRYRYLRRQKRDFEREIPASSEELAGPASDSPVAEAQRNEDQLKLTQAIAELSDEYQLVIQLRHQDKLTFAEVGEKLERSTDAARMLWNRAIEELAQKLSASDKRE